MMYRLIILNGPLINQRVSVEPSPMLIGRDPACHVAIPDEEMAREHAQIEHRPDGLYITDLGSMNRILVNKREVHEARLKHGDTIEIGRTRFLVQALVQADVEGSRRRARRRRQWRAVGVSVVLVLLAVLIIDRWVEMQVLRAAAESAARASEWIRLKDERSARFGTPEEPRIKSSAPVEEFKNLGELQQVREDIAALREKMKTLADRAPTNQSVVPSAEQTSEQHTKQRCANLLADALDAVRKGQPLQADQMLSGAMALDPSFWPAFEERARLFEQRGMAEEALRQWNEIIQRHPPPDVYERAVAERLRLGRALRTGEAKAIRIDSVDQRKVWPDEGCDEVRVLKVMLSPQSPDYLLEPQKIKVMVDFYDEFVEQNRIEPTSAVVTPRVFQWGGPWHREGSNVVSIKYVVPHSRRGGASYYGFVVRAFYNDKLQAVVAKPASLLERRMGGRRPENTEGSGS